MWFEPTLPIFIKNRQCFMYLKDNAMSRWMICFVRTLLLIDFLLLVLTCCLFPLSLFHSHFHCCLGLNDNDMWCRDIATAWLLAAGSYPYRFPPKCLFVLFLTFSAQIHPRQCVNKIWWFIPFMASEFGIKKNYFFTSIYMVDIHISFVGLCV